MRMCGKSFRTSPRSTSSCHTLPRSRTSFDMQFCTTMAAFMLISTCSPCKISTKLWRKLRDWIWCLTATAMVPTMSRAEDFPPISSEAAGAVTFIERSGMRRKLQLLDTATLPRRRRRKCAVSMTTKSSATSLGEDWASGFPTMSSHPAHPSLLSASAAMNRSTRTASSLSWSTSRSWRTRMLSSKLLMSRNLWAGGSTTSSTCCMAGRGIPVLHCSTRQHWSATSSLQVSHLAMEQ
mmetsp:Transcript_60601/g.84284  ORF Transcript_60601/g.84284 Transcript_60601/m.84284 type:complete len:237 (+) Transcript_60601:90-800(+)